MNKPIHIRHAVIDDLEQITAIYNHYVINTIITFDLDPWQAMDRIPWFDQFEADSPHPCFVGELDGKILGYACGSKLRPKAAYDTSVETTIYLHHEATGKGYGRFMYRHLLTHLQTQPVHRCYGIIALPNDASVALHKTLGFEEVGTLTEVGFKFGKYWDTVWLEKSMMNVKKD